MVKNIWVTGSIELLNHGIKHIKEPTGEDNFDFRIAMISIDNAVEATLKTYITLNRRTLRISYKTYKDAIRKFPAMLDLLHNHCPEKISADELDAIEMFHMIRNNLYHQGTGINVDREIVERYSIVAKELIVILFNVEEDIELELTTEITNLYNEFLTIWREIEVDLKNYTLIKGLIPQTQRPLILPNILVTLYKNNLIEIELVNELQDLLSHRNEIAHSHRSYTVQEMEEKLTHVKQVKDKIFDLIQR